MLKGAKIIDIIIICVLHSSRISPSSLRSCLQAYKRKQSDLDHLGALLIESTLLVSNSINQMLIGKQFELPLLIQSILMILVMFILLANCVYYGQVELRPDGNSHTLFDFELSRFWYWSNISSYFIFTTLLMLTMSLLTLQFKNNFIYVETLGFLATMTESMLTVPQIVVNFKQKSTRGMSFLMVLAWFLGDAGKTAYFIFRETPVQFVTCGVLQVFFDLILFLQYMTY